MNSRSVRVLAVASALVAVTGACGSTGEEPPAGGTRQADLQAVVSATIPVGGRGSGVEAVAVGEGAVWAAGGGECPGSVWRIDRETDELAATITVDSPLDLAVGEGAVWVLGGVCVPTPARPDGVASGAALYRIDSVSNSIATTIRLPPPPGASAADVSVSGLAFGEGAAWVSLSYGPTTGEVLRIDPRTNQVVARISTRGYAGELIVGAGAVWVLGHPEYTDETDRGESLHRIDPRTNELTTPLSDERLNLGAYFLPPVIAAGPDALWIGSTEASYPYGPLAIRIDARTNAVRREPLSMDRFFPLAVAEGAVWFLGPGANLSRLDPRTLKVEASVNLRANVADAAFDSAARSLWLAATAVRQQDQSSVVRVDLR